MKLIAKTLILVSALIFFKSHAAELDQKDYALCDSLYKQWHNILDANPHFTEPMWCDPRTKGMASVISEMNKNITSMAYYLSGKIAYETNCSYQDIWLLDYVAGINLWYPEHATDEIGGALATNLANFRQEWRAGVYKDPSAKIAQLCQDRLSKENGDKVNPRDVVALRRYGIFGLPELVRQMKQHNSKHAFAAYLIIANQSDSYSDYLSHSNQQFTNAEDKINHVKAKVEKMKTPDNNESDVMRKISTALTN